MMLMDAEFRTIYAVTQGEYDDYRVRALFEYKGDAETARAAGAGDAVEEFPYFPEGNVPVPVKYWRAYGEYMHEDHTGTFNVSAIPVETWTGDREIPHSDQFPLIEIKVNPHGEGPDKGKPWRTTVAVHAMTEFVARETCLAELEMVKARALAAKTEAN